MYAGVLFMHLYLPLHLSNMNRLVGCICNVCIGMSSFICYTTCHPLAKLIDWWGLGWGDPSLQIFLLSQREEGLDVPKLMQQNLFLYVDDAVSQKCTCMCYSNGTTRGSWTRGDASEGKTRMKLELESKWALNVRGGGGRSLGNRWAMPSFMHPHNDSIERNIMGLIVYNNKCLIANTKI